MPQIETLERIEPSRLAADRPKRMPRFARVVMPLAIVGAIFVGILFRVVDLNHVPGINGDEAWSGVQAMRFLHGETVAWRTPTGNPINLFFWGPLVALHTVFVPSAALLRSVSAASGILAIGMNYWMCRKTFDRTTAIISTVLLAVLPLLIAYSRFAWDSSQTPFFSTVVLFSALQVTQQVAGRRAVRFVLFAAMLAAIWVHPTNIFLLPLVAVCLCRVPYWRTLPPKFIYLAVGGAVAAAFVMRSPTDLLRFIVDFGRLLNGATAYRFISGGVSGTAIDFSDLLTWSILIAAFYGFRQRIRTEHYGADERLAIGLLTALTGFFIVAGPHGLEPHFERYAIWMVVPTVLVVSRGTAWWLCESRSTRIATFAVSSAVVASLLASFDVCYFRVFATSGGESHLAFSTGDIDPKERALNAILATSEPSAPVTIVSENWWTRLPIEYLAANESRVRVLQHFDGSMSNLPKNAYFVELAGTKDEQTAIDRLSSNHVDFHRIVETDRLGRPIVAVFRVVNSPPVADAESGR